MRQKIIAGNWKMNKTFKEGIDLVDEVLSLTEHANLHNVHVIFGTPFIHLRKVSKQIKKHNHFHLAAQNCHWEESGAFTGEVSVPMLESVGCEYVIIGHSERRQYFYESNDICARKIEAALKHNIKPIYCVGETQDVRESKRHFTHVELQIVEGLFSLTADQMKNVVIAYEPVWAIGTGLTASPAQAQEMHAFIRKAIEQQYSNAIASQIQILYGGSMKPSNVTELLSQQDVDGGLIGGASLQGSDFAAMIKAAASVSTASAK